MSFMSAVADAGLLSGVSEACGLDEAAVKSAMEALCQAIARKLQQEAKDDPDLLGSLLDLLEDNSASDGPTGEEAMLDGNAVLKSLYGSKAAAAAALQGAVPDVPHSAMPVLAPVSAAAVLAAIAQQQQASPLAGAMPLAGGSILGTIVSAIIAGAVREAVRQITSTTRRRTSTSGSRTTTRSRKRSPARKTRTARKRGSSDINLEDILGGIFGTRGNQEK